MKIEKPQTPTEYNKPKRQILGVDQLDDVGLALITLTREVVVLQDRMMLLEDVLEKKGIDVASEIDGKEPDAALQSRLDVAQSKIIQSVVGALSGPK